jgi:hypothetical protein
MYYAQCVMGFLTALNHATLSHSVQHVDRCLWSAGVLVFAYMLNEDDYILIFYQIHVLWLFFMVYCYTGFFELHLGLTLLYIVFTLHRMSRRIPSAENDASNVAVVALVLGGASVTLMVLDRFFECDAPYFDPADSLQLRAVGNLLAGCAMYLLVVVSGFYQAKTSVRAYHGTYNVDYAGGFLPYVRRTKPEYLRN